MNTCIFANIYSESPEFQKIALHTCAIISAPLSLLGFYMILCKTPEQMKSAKLYILNLHICNTLLDFCTSFLCTSLFLFPAFAVVPLGLSQYIGVPIIIQIMTGMICVAFTAFAIMALFESRFYIICEFPGKKYWKFWRHVWLYGHHIYFMFATFSFYFAVPDQEKALKKLLKNIPCLPDHLKSAPIFVPADGIGFHLILTIASVFTVFVELSSLCLFLVHNISKKMKNHRISQKTLRIQKIFLTALFLQTTLPLITIAFPLLYIYYSMFFDYYNQSLTNIGMTCMSTHGFMSSIVMIMVHRPYREAFFDLIGKPKKMEMKEVSMRTTKLDVIKH